VTSARQTADIVGHDSSVSPSVRIVPYIKWATAALVSALSILFYSVLILPLGVTLSDI